MIRVADPPGVATTTSTEPAEWAGVTAVSVDALTTTTLVARPTDDLEAYQLFLRGREGVKARAILRATVGALAHALRRVVAFPKRLE